MTTTLEFDDDSSLEMADLEVEAVIEPKAGDVLSWKRNVSKSIKAPYNSIMGLGMIAYNSLLEQGREAMLQLDELLFFLIDDDSTAKWCAATEMPEEELTKCKILRHWIVKEMKNNAGRFL
jgi:hypothetical protein